ncbi:hypothetical protein ACQPZF_15725 [Actinosynnema sp. CS-041913]|uniref:hypothetical protein n=1 Tax=Actinosynnema sp. CS-041913 TaxID=3239917 RepID=UPI003D8EDEEF
MNGMWFVSFADSAVPAPGGGDAGCAAAERARRRMAELGAYFGTDHLTAGTGALCLESGRHATQAIFTETWLRDRRHYLHLRGAKKLTGAVTDAARLDLVTGVCLYSSATVRFTDERGDSPALLHPGVGRLTGPLRRIVADDELSVYEREAIVRQSRVIADLLAVLPADLPTTVTIDVPRVQYYCYLLDAFRRGHVRADLMLRWFDLVDARHTQLTGAFRARLRTTLDSVRRADVAVRTAPGLDPLAQRLRDAVSGTGSRMPPIRDLVAVQAAADPVWEVLQRVQPPRDRDQLWEMSYTVEVLRAIGIHDTGGRALAMMVDRYAEFPILQHAQRVQRRIDQSSSGLPVLGLYPAERVINVGRDGVPESLYFQDASRYVVADDHTTVDLFPLIDGLYEAPGESAVRAR